MHKKRQEKIFSYLKQSGIHAALLFDFESNRNPAVRYLTGLPMDGMVLLLREGISILIPWDIHLAKKTAQADEFIPFTNFDRNIVQAVSKLMQRYGISGNGKIEIQNTATYLLVGEMQETFGKENVFCQIKGINALLNSMRMVKSPEEIPLIKKSAEITNTVINGIETGITNGTLATELDIALYIEREARRQGAEGLGFETIVAGPFRSYAIHAFPSYTSASLESPGLSIIDFGIIYEGYTSDVTITIARRPLSKEQKNQLTLLEKAYKKALSFCRPGATTKQAAEAVDNFLYSHGHTMPHSLGHGIGLEAHEAPILKKTEAYNRKMEAGMVFTIEPGIYNTAAGGCRLENDILITEAGCSVLTESHIMYV